MRFIPCLQGTPEWLSLRAGVITASMFADATARLTRASGDRKAGDFSTTSDKYRGDVAFEIISGKPYGEPPKAWTLQRGHELEPLARQAYEMRTGNIAMEAGICLTDDGRFGYSTDGLVHPVTEAGRIMSCKGLIEIKCPVDSNKIMAVLDTGDVSEYMHQMQGGMWLTGAQWCDFIQYVPDLANVGKDLFVKRVLRDEEFIAKLETDLIGFRLRVDELVRRLRTPASNDAASAEAQQAA